MNGEVIYEKKFDLTDYEDEEEDKSDKAGPTQKKLSFAEYMNEVYRSISFVPIPEHIERANEFVRLAISVSEKNMIDLRIVRYDQFISAVYSFNSLAIFWQAGELISMADEVAVADKTDGYDVTVCVNYYTVAVMRNGRRISP